MRPSGKTAQKTSTDTYDGRTRDVYVFCRNLLGSNTSCESSNWRDECAGKEKDARTFSGSEVDALEALRKLDEDDVERHAEKK